MHDSGRVVASLLTGAMLTACVAARETRTAAPRDAGAGSPAAGMEASTAEPLRRALRTAAADPASAGELHLFVECLRGDELQAVEIYGDGVGIWNGRRQFRIGRRELEQLLEALVETDFAAMAPLYGGPAPADIEAPGEKPGALAAIKIVCRVNVDLDGHSKAVAQRMLGEQSAELWALADRFFEVCEVHAAQGIEAGSLAEGLEMVARGELAPQAFAFTLHRRPEDPAAPDAVQGFLLRLDGGRLTARNLIPFSGYEEPLAVELGAAEIAEIAAELLRQSPWEWPGNLWARDYHDFGVRVLAHEKAVQARRFAGVGATTHGRRQQEFDAVVSRLEELYARVLEEGVPRPIGDAEG